MSISSSEKSSEMSIITGDRSESDWHPPSMFPCIVALGHTVGWVVQWEEMITDPEQKIGRPRQLYVGHARRDVP